jgi:hypothetical protein
VSIRSSRHGNEVFFLLCIGSSHTLSNNCINKYTRKKSDKNKINKENIMCLINTDYYCSLNRYARFIHGSWDSKTRSRKTDDSP